MEENTIQNPDLPKIMVDNCIGSNANPARWERVELEPIGGIQFTNKLIVCRGKELHCKSERLNRDMPYVHAIAQAAKENKFSLYTYMELQCEQMMGYHSMTSWCTPFYPLQGISYKTVDPPIIRGEFFESMDWLKKEEIDKFISWLIKLDKSETVNFKQSKRPIRSNFDKLDEFQKMVAEIGKKSARDIYHFWVAECNNLDYFLTVDYKFLDSYKKAVKNKRIATKCVAVSPKELADQFSLSIENIKLPKEGQLYLMNGCEYHG